jgi:hypothetical protein
MGNHAETMHKILFGLAQAYKTSLAVDIKSGII